LPEREVPALVDDVGDHAAAHSTHSVTGHLQQDNCCISIIQKFDSPKVYTATCIFTNPNSDPNPDPS